MGGDFLDNPSFFNLTTHYNYYFISLSFTPYYYFIIYHTYTLSIVFNHNKISITQHTERYMYPISKRLFLKGGKGVA